MDNPFNKIDKPLHEVPVELKDKVMKDIAMAKLLMELADLFSLNVGSVIENTISKRKDSLKKSYGVKTLRGGRPAPTPRPTRVKLSMLPFPGRVHKRQTTFFLEI